MSQYKIVIDSCGELPEDLKADGHFCTVPLLLDVDGYQITDDETFNQRAANLYLMRKEIRTMALSLYTFVGPMGSKYNLICAGVIISLLPALIVFVCCQKQIYSGIAAGAVKG